LDACPRCGLRFAGEPEDRAALAELIALHARHCAGVDRSMEEWVPYREVYASRQCHVVVVDDDVGAREALCTFLQLAGHRVEQARDAAHAVELGLDRTPDVMLIDIGLRGMDGYQVAHRIRTARLERRPFLVALTGYSQAEDRRRAREAGFDEYLLKPVDVEDIERVVAAGCLRELRDSR
jgi:CheY-like chemotaxis protein